MLVSDKFYDFSLQSSESKAKVMKSKLSQSNKSHLNSIEVKREVKFLGRMIPLVDSLSGCIRPSERAAARRLKMELESKLANLKAS